MRAISKIDPAKLVWPCLRNDASICGMLLAAECIVMEHSEKKEAAAAGAIGGNLVCGSK